MNSCKNCIFQLKMIQTVFRRDFRILISTVLNLEVSGSQDWKQNYFWNKFIYHCEWHLLPEDFYLFLKSFNILTNMMQHMHMYVDYIGFERVWQLFIKYSWKPAVGLYKYRRWGVIFSSLSLSCWKKTFQVFSIELQ